jgi:3-methylcrotonyl-CoA carboxylase alpha subunit
MFDKILIANRGEIACRVAATARRLGIRTVAVYSDADARSRHVAACDEAWRLGPAPARESYLRGDEVIRIALASGARAIHPGYGFLSENEAFARAVAEAGLVFIGPPASAIAAMGSKSAAKTLMEKAGVPLVPGYHGSNQDPAWLREQADAIGYPVLIKASAGGGGKGMRIVQASGEFEAMLASCKREARSAFGDDAVLIERYVQRPRHIEIQVFGDSHGNCVYLFERDCSVQRRHQKVLEEAPAPDMPPARRAAMGKAAVDAARAVGYVGAGTVEFIVNQDGTFYFMEMNTRLQVEHPVTEMITGVDLVEWQLRVAAGEPLPLAQDQLRIGGHAIEARIYAEDPDRGFLPSIGTLAHLVAPATSAVVRVDTGVRAGDAITPYYDPMIAKLIVHGEDRAMALRRLDAALAGWEIVGVATNVAFLRRLASHAAFATAKLDTGLIARRATRCSPRRWPRRVRWKCAPRLPPPRPVIRIRRGTPSIRGGPAPTLTPCRSSTTTVAGATPSSFAATATAGARRCPTPRCTRGRRRVATGWSSPSTAPSSWRRWFRWARSATCSSTATRGAWCSSIRWPTPATTSRTAAT